ncbi:hypothetical protein ECE50_017015 [Chitinophaga sp. Mgbs1]|uniref:YD repeat-containing protein n=1 Tax=Chitinophaga solisilvae TaxID=1233460 RepID=A0A9Q5DCX7_9BACT|nr:hypothetical protein [Chitinophaga solisilvae]
MKKYLYCLLIPVLITACSSNKNKYRTILRLSSIGIKGDSIPQYTFRYDQEGHLVELVKYHQFNDTNNTTFTYDSSNRLCSMTAVRQHNNSRQVQQHARVNAWDKDGNIREIAYFDPAQQLIRTATITWKHGLPAALKYSDSTQAVKWENDNGNPDWKNICSDSLPEEMKEGNLLVRNTQHEWDQNYNPLRPLVNQLLLSGCIPLPAQTRPVPDFASLLLPISTNNPTLIKMEEKEKTAYSNTSMECQRQTTLQFDYTYNWNGYPQSAWVHFHTEGFTRLSGDSQLIIDYQYQ